MPKIERQVANGAPLTEVEQILAKVQPVCDVRVGLRLSVYGRGKTGKTRLATTFPKPVCLLGTEVGTESVANVPGVDFVKIESTKELDVWTNYLAERGRSCWKNNKGVWVKVPRGTGDPYESGGLDTAGGTQDIITKEILGLKDIPLSKDWGMAPQKVWGAIVMQTKEVLYKFLRLAETRVLQGVCIIAHERNFKDEDIDTDVILPVIGSAVSPMVSSWLNGACSFVCQTYIREEVIKESVETIPGEPPMITETKTGKKQFCLRVGPHSIYYTGFRCTTDLPQAEIVNPNFDKIVKLSRGEKV